jgi:hypothetical protein
MRKSELESILGIHTFILSRNSYIFFYINNSLFLEFQEYDIDLSNTNTATNWLFFILFLLSMSNKFL